MAIIRREPHPPPHPHPRKNCISNYMQKNRVGISGFTSFFEMIPQSVHVITPLLITISKMIANDTISYTVVLWSVDLNNLLYSTNSKPASEDTDIFVYVNKKYYLNVHHQSYKPTT